MPDESKPKAKSKRRERAQRIYNHGGCPSGQCKHPPADHRPVANTKQHFCYGSDCMCVCVPAPSRKWTKVK